MREQTEQDDGEVEQMDEYHTAPLRFPLHVLDGDGNALCSSMADDQRRFVDRYGVDEQPTLREKQGDGKLMWLLSDLCGNCRRSLFSEDGTEPLREEWKEMQTRIQQVKA
jgi:hypothetical protein